MKNGILRVIKMVNRFHDKNGKWFFMCEFCGYKTQDRFKNKKDAKEHEDICKSKRR